MRNNQLPARGIINGILISLLLWMLILYGAKAFAGTAFYTGEMVSGLNKVCFYDHLGSTVAITIKGYQLCPLTIEV